MHAKKQKIYPRKDISYLSFKTTQSMKNKLFFNDFRRRRVALSCSKSIIWIIEIASKNNGDFHGLHCLHSFRPKKLKSHKKYVKTKFYVLWFLFLSVMMPSEDVKILEFNQYHKSGKKNYRYFMQMLNLW